MLEERGVPFVILTGYDPDVISEVLREHRAAAKAIAVPCRR